MGRDAARRSITVRSSPVVPPDARRVSAGSARAEPAESSASGLRPSTERGTWRGLPPPQLRILRGMPPIKYRTGQYIQWKAGLGYDAAMLWLRGTRQLPTNEASQKRFAQIMLRTNHLDPPRGCLASPPPASYTLNVCLITSGSRPVTADALNRNHPGDIFYDHDDYPSSG